MSYYSTEALNKAQKKIVDHKNGPALVIAGAGSGKTRVITHRVAHLIHSGIPPSSILLLTFTNKAAREMRDRVSAIIGPMAEQIWLGTFHALCARLRRRHAVLI